MDADNRLIDVDEYSPEKEIFGLTGTQRGLIYGALSVTVLLYVLNIWGITPRLNLGGWNITTVITQGLDIGVGVVMILVFWFPYLKFHQLPASAQFAIVLICLVSGGRIFNYATASYDTLTGISAFTMINTLTTLLYVTWYIILLTNDSKKYHDFKKIKTFAGVSLGSILVPTMFYWLFSFLVASSEFFYYIPITIIHLIPTGYMFYIISKIPQAKPREI